MPKITQMRGVLIESSHHNREEDGSMKKAKTAVVSAIAAILTAMAKAFAASPCNGPAYEPKVPDILADR